MSTFLFICMNNKYINDKRIHGYVYVSGYDRLTSCHCAYVLARALMQSGDSTPMRRARPPVLVYVPHSQFPFKAWERGHNRQSSHFDLHCVAWRLRRSQCSALSYELFRGLSGSGGRGWAMGCRRLKALSSQRKEKESRKK